MTYRIITLILIFWFSVSLVAQTTKPDIFTQDPNWIALTKRLVPNSLLKVDNETLKKITGIN